MKRGVAALVDESRCIGCKRCIDACPVDAIIGAQGVMHTVVESWCIGCKLCLPPCPVDCIVLVAPSRPWTPEHKRAAKKRAVSRKQRLSKVFLPVGRHPRDVIAAALARKRRS
jgi:Na+-translocating ferredoxin:NAD+ oxidoreductase subunit B